MQRKLKFESSFGCKVYQRVPALSVQIPIPYLNEIGSADLEMKLVDGQKILYIIY
jgi:hypothetical protein